MHRKLVVRAAVALFAVGALAPVTALAIGAGSASASGGGSQISCAKLKGNESTQTLSKCTGPLNIVGGTKPGKGTGSSSAASAPMGYQEGQSVSWNGGAGGTITVGINFTLGSGCPGKDDTIIESGTVVSGSGNASVLVGDSATGTACLNLKKGTLSNEKGSDFTY
jgi:hypothetical protein